MHRSDEAEEQFGGEAVADPLAYLLGVDVAVDVVDDPVDRHGIGDQRSVQGGQQLPAGVRERERSEPGGSGHPRDGDADGEVRDRGEALIDEGVGGAAPCLGCRRTWILGIAVPARVAVHRRIAVPTRSPVHGGIAVHVRGPVYAEVAAHAGVTVHGVGGGGPMYRALRHPMFRPPGHPMFRPPESRAFWRPRSGRASLPVGIGMPPWIREGNSSRNTPD